MKINFKDDFERHAKASQLANGLGDTGLGRIVEHEESDEDHL